MRTIAYSIPSLIGYIAHCFGGNKMCIRSKGPVQPWNMFYSYDFCIVSLVRWFYFDSCFQSCYKMAVILHILMYITLSTLCQIWNMQPKNEGSFFFEVAKWLRQLHSPNKPLGKNFQCAYFLTSVWNIVKIVYVWLIVCGTHIFPMILYFYKTIGIEL